MYLLCSAHQYISYSWYHIDLYAMFNAIFQNDVSLVAVNAAEENSFYSIQFFEMVNDICYLDNLRNFKFAFQIVLIYKLLHSFSDIVNDHCLLRRETSEVPAMSQETPDQ